ncbi:uncharacterized protein J7T55_001360 [Diaporthe amygdali]|uniref:uncharacterized protein n=1 Tax=Phomopsis amygdali TaxID=1214568 RepID=UPI0022FDCF3F|nr:uncharacterized protein J7T55_001360 [Diaporthe amygdali]KAJ0103787.1 uncharacterized protein J7T55_001360 [Diaporthe amygdali]
MTTPGSQSSHASSGGSRNSSARQSSGDTIPDALSVEEYGRMFNAYREGKYLLPNDGDEQDRLDLQHHMWRLLLRGRLSIAPIGEPASVLDIGTGTGIWAIQFAKQHPGADVVGTDLSLIQPTDNVPPNCRFEREDSEEDWVHDVPFDYIHWRLMCTCFSDIKGMMAKVYGNLKPGGWAEFHDVAWELVGADDEASAVLDGSALAKFFRYAVAGGTAFGRDFEAGRKYKEWMVEAGFEGVVERQVLAPVNAWPLDPVDRTIGNWFCVDVHRVLDGTTKLLEAGGLPLAEIPSFLDDVRESITSREMRVYCPRRINCICRVIETARPGHRPQRPGAPDACCAASLTTCCNAQHTIQTRFWKLSLTLPQTQDALPKERTAVKMGNSSSRPFNPRNPPEIYHDLGYGAILAQPMVAPAEAPRPKGRRTMSFARRSTAVSSRRVIGGYPKNYHW